MLYELLSLFSKITKFCERIYFNITWAYCSKVMITQIVEVDLVRKFNPNASFLNDSSII